MLISETKNNNKSGGLKAVISNNENVKPNSDLLNTLKSALPEFFEKDTVDEEGNITRHGAFKIDKFNEEIKANNIAEAHDGYKLSFVGKDYARLQTGRRSETMIVPDSKHNALPKNKNSSNIFITGNNIDALRHLVNAYENQIKLIYIDPPYNTGSKDFVYSDTFEFNDEKLQSALGYTDAEITRLKSIQGKSSHSAWLTFMYPLLKLARKLLTPDGVIFVSIDDNEQANLKLLMDEVFGEGNFVGTFIWRKKDGGGQTKEYFVVEHENIIAYKKSDALIWIDREIARNITEFNKTDKIGSYKITKLAKWGNTARREDRPSMYFPLTAPDTNEVYPVAPDGNEGRWRIGKIRMDELISNDLIHWGKKDDTWIAYEKEYFDNQNKILKQRSILYDIANTGDGSNFLTEIFDRKDIFENPKPIELIKTFLSSATTNHIPNLILDFFAGSATTAHAVMQLNAEDGGNRKFIMVQWAEQTKEDSEARKAGYKTIDEISRERIKRAGAKILKEYTEKEALNAGELPLEDEQTQQKWDKDIGFKHYRLITPDVKTLDKIETFDPAAPVLIAEDMISPFANPATETSGIETLLTTWLIDDGFTFDTAVETLAFGDYVAHLIQSKLYLIAPDWGSKQTKELLNRIGKNELNVQHIVVYAYSFLMESLRELEINIKNTLDADHQVYIERRY